MLVAMQGNLPVGMQGQNISNNTVISTPTLLDQIPPAIHHAQRTIHPHHLAAHLVEHVQSLQAQHITLSCLLPPISLV